MNLIQKSVAKIRPRVDDLDPEERVTFERKMDITFEEHFAYQNAQARAHALGKITTDEALAIYAALGEVGSPDNGGWAAGTDLPTKVAVTLTVGALIGARS